MYRNGSLRLKGFDYTVGVFFVTINAHFRRPLFGEICNKEFIPGDLGLIVIREWEKTGAMRPQVELDVFQLMPDHFHAIVILHKNEVYQGIQKFTQKLDSVSEFKGKGNTLGSIMGLFKGAATRKINEYRQSKGFKVWQPDYYEYVIRNRMELQIIRNYISNNPVNYKIPSKNASKQL